MPAIFFDGPQSALNRDGDEVPEWVVYLGNDDADPIGPVYRIRDFADGARLAERMATDRQLELVHEASRD